MGPPPSGQPASGLGAPLWPVHRGPFPVDAGDAGQRDELVGGRAGDGSQRSARCAPEAIRRRLPFRLRQIHPDHDSSVLDHLLVEYCRDNRIASCARAR